MLRNISLGTRSQARRPAPETANPWQPGRPARRVLLHLERYRYLTSDLLAFLYEADKSRGLWTVRKTLTSLWRHGYVERFHRPTDWGSRQYVYTLSLQGAQDILTNEDYAAFRGAIGNRARPKSDYEHALAVAVLQMLWELGAKSRPDLLTPIELWRDREGLRGKVINSFGATVGKSKIRVEPDLTVLYAHRDGSYRPVFFEVERVHKNFHRTREKLLAYESLVSAKGRAHVADVFASHTSIRPTKPATVVYVAADEVHASRLRAVAQEVLKRTGGLWFTHLEKLFRVVPETRRDGSTVRHKQGHEIMRELPIEPVRFISDPLLTSVAGAPGKLVV